MSWVHFTDPISHMRPAGAMVASWYLTQQVAGLNPFIAMIHILSLKSVNSLKTFRENLIAFYTLY